MRRALQILLLALALAGLATAASAEIRIVAFGDSGTYGSGYSSFTRAPGGVPQSQAFPAQIERRLRARGWDVTVVNEGVPGDRASRALARVPSAVPPGTVLTIVELGGNDRKYGESRQVMGENLRAIGNAIAERGSAVLIVTAGFGSGPNTVHWLQGLRDRQTGRLLPQYDSGDAMHLNVAGNELVAERAIPDIERVLRRLGFQPSR